MVYSMYYLTDDATSVCWIKHIDKARDMLDTELSALAGESYSRAYGVSIYLLICK